MDMFLPTANLVLDEASWSPITRTGTLMASLSTPTAACPRCQTASPRIHSRYTRTLHDLPWASFTMTLLLHVRRFRCRVPTCAQQIFTERVPGVVAPFARRTERLQQIQHGAALQINNHRAIGLPFAEGPIIDADNVGSGLQWVGGALDKPQDGGAADWTEALLADQCARNAAQGQAELLLEGG